MFEKDAEEYATQEVFFDGVPKPVINHQRKDDWQKGAEFGYNKANEWHKVRDKLPPIDEVVYLWQEDERFPACAYRHIPYGKTEKDWFWNCYWGSGYTVNQSEAKDYWWKEIVLPELKESE